MTGGQERAAEVFESAVRNPVIVQQDVRRKVGVLGAQPVGNPRPHARGQSYAASRMHQQRRLTMQRKFAHHRPHDAQLVRHRRSTWEEITHPQTAFAPLLELPGTTEPDPAGVRLRFLRDPARADCLSLMLLEHRLVIEGIDMARAAIHETENHTASTGGKVRCHGRRSSGCHSLQGEHPKTRGRLLQEAAPGLDRANCAGASVTPMCHDTDLRVNQ